MNFTKIGFTGSLYELKGNQGAWCGLFLAEGAGKDTITLEEALTVEALAASFLLTAEKPNFGGEEEERQFIDKVRKILEDSYCSRALLWITNLSAPENSYSMCALSQNGAATSRDSQFTLETGIGITVRGQSKVSLTKEQDGLLIGTKGHNTAVFTGRYSPMAEAGSGDVLAIRLWGKDAGTLIYEQVIPRSVLAEQLYPGFQLVLPAKEQQTGSRYVAQWYPFAPAAGTVSQERYAFVCRILPLYPKGTFDGEEPIIGSEFFFRDSGVKLDTWYLTPDGKQAALMPVSFREGESTGQLPAGFVPVPGTPELEGAVKQRVFVFSPMGDYAVLPGDDPECQEIMCGLNGVEKLALCPRTEDGRGDYLRFTAGKAGFIPVFPLPKADPLGTPADMESGTMSSEFTMSYVSAVSASGNTGRPCYVAQPEEARLFGKGDGDILLPMETGAELTPPPGETCFPMVPYGGTRQEETSGTLTAGQILELEKTILAAERKKLLDSGWKAGTRNGAPARHLRGGAGKKQAGRLQTVVTPSGVLADIDESSGSWENIWLGQYQADTGLRGFGFAKPDRELQQAFENSQLCLVAANDSHFPGGAGFQNRLEADGWEFTAQTGAENHYGDYRSVMIIKSCKGSVLELMQNPSKWTMAEEFASPSAGGQGQLTVLSQWITAYIEESAEKGELYRSFNKLVRDENWSGVLVLKAAVTGLPQNLRGLTAGLDRSRFFAHHFAVGFSDIDSSSMSQNGTSAISGLIDYSDTAYDDSMGEQPVAPGPGDYDFKVLRLVCLIEYAAVKRFYSLAQLCMQQCFGSRVTSMEDIGNIFKALLLHGTYQDHGGTPVYQMTIVEENGLGASTFLLESSILKRMRVNAAQMSTEEENDSRTVSLITMDGILCFEVMEYQDAQGNPYPFDLYSYGEENAGLAFQSLSARIVEENGGTEITLETDTLLFDSLKTKARQGSLAGQFAMTADGLVRGGDQLPKELGYLPLTSEVRLSSLQKGEWYGLRFLLDMGSPGALAAQAGLKSEVLLAWGTKGDSLRGYLGLKLPGASQGENFFSLENILKLSVGSLRLVRDETQDAFVMILTDIALKFLGILNLPPSGSACFYLFADPKGAQNGKGLGWYAAYNREPKKKGGDAGTAEEAVERRE